MKEQTYFESLKYDFRRRLRKASFVLEIIGVVGVFGYATIAALQWCAMRTANRQSLEVFQATERPWLSIKAIITGPFVFDSDGGKIDTDFFVQNWGHSPATHVSLWGELVAPQVLDTFEPLNKQKMCEGTQRTSAQHPNGKRLGISIFPTNTFDFKETWQIIPEGIAKGHQVKGFPNKVSRYIWPQIVGCVIYHFGDDTYWTGFRYEVFRKNPTNPNLPTGIVPEGSISPSDLVFEESDGGNDAY